MSQSSLRVWVDASRPKTLAAAFTPVLVGVALAFRYDAINWAASLVALFCAFLIQIGTNFANDYYDFKKGADTADRIGFIRATSAGLIAPEVMLRATGLTMFIAFLSGLYLVWIGGWIVLAIGLLSILFGILYTGGPYPLGYNGLGDVFVFLFFGIVAVMTTYYINAQEWLNDSFWASLAIGALCTNILVINNLRDVAQDVVAGKRTLGVLFGDRALKIEYTLMLAMAFAVPPHFYFRLGYDAWIFLPFLSIPIAAGLLRAVWFEENKRKLNPVLERTAQYMAIFGILFSIGIIL